MLKTCFLNKNALSIQISEHSTCTHLNHAFKDSFGFGFSRSKRLEMTKQIYIKKKNLHTPKLRVGRISPMYFSTPVFVIG